MSEDSRWKRPLEYLNLVHPEPSRARRRQPLGRVVLLEQRIEALEARVEQLEIRG